MESRNEIQQEQQMVLHSFDGLIFNTMCYYTFYNNFETIYPNYMFLLISWVTNYLVNPIKNHSSKQLTSLPDAFHDRVPKYFTRESYTEKMRHTRCQKWGTRELTGILIHVSYNKLNWMKSCCIRHCAYWLHMNYSEWTASYHPFT